MKRALLRALLWIILTLGVAAGGMVLVTCILIAINGDPWALISALGGGLICWGCLALAGRYLNAK